jgi:hypothetical protein
MAKRGFILTHPVIITGVLLLIGALVLQYYWFKREGFQSGGSQVIELTARYTSATAPITAGTVPSELAGATFTGGVKQLTLNNIPLSLGTLINVAVEYKNTNTAFTPLLAAKFDSGSTTVVMEHASGPFRKATAALGTGDTQAKLPLTVAELGRMLRIRNLEVGNLQGIKTGQNPNIKIKLTFAAPDS